MDALSWVILILMACIAVGAGYALCRETEPPRPRSGGGGVTDPGNGKGSQDEA